MSTYRLTLGASVALLLLTVAPGSNFAEVPLPDARLYRTTTEGSPLFVGDYSGSRAVFLGHCYSAQQPGTVPLKQMRNRWEKFVAIVDDEAMAHFGKLGYGHPALLCYIAAAPEPDEPDYTPVSKTGDYTACPLRRLFNGSAYIVASSSDDVRDLGSPDQGGYSHGAQLLGLVWRDMGCHPTGQ